MRPSMMKERKRCRHRIWGRQCFTSGACSDSKSHQALFFFCEFTAKGKIWQDFTSELRSLKTCLPAIAQRATAGNCSAYTKVSADRRRTRRAVKFFGFYSNVLREKLKGLPGSRFSTKFFFWKNSMSRSGSKIHYRA